MIRKLCLFILLLFVPTAFAAPMITTSHFSTVEQQAHQLGHRYGNAKVLLVFDLDDTLLTLDQMLGNATWFTWQSDLLTKNPRSPFLVASDFNGLLNAEGLLFQKTSMHPVEANIPMIIKTLQKEGFKMIVLSDRGAYFGPMTEKRLAENHLDFSSNALTLITPLPSPYYPYSKARLVVYMKGVLFIAGDDKGLVLKDFLPRTREPMKAAIVMDDALKELQNINQQTPHMQPRFILIHYTHLNYLHHAFKTKIMQLKMMRAWKIFRIKYHIKPSQLTRLMPGESKNPGK